MIAIFAHGFGGTNGLPLPRSLFTYLLGFAIVLTFVVLRVVAPKPRPPREESAAAPVASASPSIPFLIARAVGLALFVGTLLAAAVGTNDNGANIAPTTVIVMFFLGAQVASVLLGDVYWAFNPFDTIAALIFGRDDHKRLSPADPPSWTAAAFLFAFFWFVFAYPEFYPPTPSEVAVFLATYTIAVVAGAAVWGRGWVRDGEGFSVLFAQLARLSPLAWDRDRRRLKLGPPVRGAEGGADSTGTVAVLIVFLGGVLFDGLSQTNWWITVLGTSRAWSERLLNSVGLIWCVAVIGCVYVGACRVIARMSRRSAGDVVKQFAGVLLPVGAAWSIAHYLTAFLIDVQNFVALLSDPLGRGWDLFGTINNSINYRLLTPSQTGWIQTLTLAFGCLGGALVAHDIAFSSYRGRTAARVTYPLATAVILAAAGSIWLLLGT